MTDHSHKATITEVVAAVGEGVVRSAVVDIRKVLGNLPAQTIKAKPLLASQSHDQRLTGVVAAVMVEGPLNVEGMEDLA